ncbi:unnamed protein product [Effrenium voratum]|nr:unnamed protein product [Effrenium voratum]
MALRDDLSGSDAGSGAAMWVLRVADFMTFEWMPSHEELRAKGLLLERKEGFLCIFVSHQWLGTSHPDPQGEQLPVLQQALRKLLAGASIKEDLYAQFFMQSRKFTERQRAALKDAYLWLDWFSIPQLESYPSDPSPSSSLSFASQEDFIQMIPDFISMSDMFVVLTPRCRHAVTGTFCGFGTWTERGWCRLELWCKMLSENTNFPVICVSGPGEIEYATQFFWMDRPPYEGQFTYNSDRDMVLNVIRKALTAKLRVLKARGKWDAYRFYVARYDTMLGQPCRQRSPEEFLKDFRLPGLNFQGKSRNLTPVACAALSGDAKMIAKLADVGHDVNRSVGPLPELYIFEAKTPLMLAVWLGYRNLAPVRALIKCRADVNAVTGFGNPLLGFCRSPQAVDCLVSQRAEVNQQVGSSYMSPLGLACCWDAPPELIACFLKHGADVNPKLNGLGSVHPLANLAISSSISPTCLSSAALLLDARADPNHQYTPRGVWRGRELLCRGLTALGGGAVPLIVHYFAESSTTPLGFACFFGGPELVDLLLARRADVARPNLRGTTPLQLARSPAVLEVLQLHLGTFSI